MPTLRFKEWGRRVSQYPKMGRGLSVGGAKCAPHTFQRRGGGGAGSRVAGHRAAENPLPTVGQGFRRPTIQVLKEYFFTKAFPEWATPR